MPISAALGSSALLPAGLGFRNVLINGGMDIWQRGTAVKYNAGQGAYGPDRWCGAHQYQTSRTQRVSVTPTSSDLWCPYACRVSNPSSAEIGIGSRMRLEQKVESFNSYPLRGRLVTLSFWIRFSASSFTATSGSYGNFGYAIGAYTSSTDSATNTTASDFQKDASINSGSFPTTWTKYTLTYSVPANANNVEVIFGMADVGIHTSSDVNWYEITQVQLEANYQPTPFEQRPFGLELALCQRYYEKSYDIGTTPGTNTNVGIIYIYGTNDGGGYIGGNIKFAVAKRTSSYTVRVWSLNGSSTTSWNFGTSSSSGTNAVNAAFASTNQVTVYVYANTGWAASYIYGHYAIENEL